MRAPISVEMVKVGAMALKTVVPGVPKSAKDQELQEEDLQRIGCHGLTGRPWGLRMEEMVSELMSDKDNRWHGTVHQTLEKWTAKEWRKVYGFAREDEGMASRIDRFIDSKFSTRVNPKDGFAVADCYFRGFIWGETCRLKAGSEGRSAAVVFRDGQVQGDSHRSLFIPYVSCA